MVNSSATFRFQGDTNIGAPDLEYEASNAFLLFRWEHAVYALRNSPRFICAQESARIVGLPDDGGAICLPRRRIEPKDRGPAERPSKKTWESVAAEAITDAYSPRELPTHQCRAGSNGNAGIESIP